MAALLSYAGTLLRQVNPSIPELPDSGSKLRGSWYLSPEQVRLTCSHATIR